MTLEKYDASVQPCLTRPSRVHRVDGLSTSRCVDACDKAHFDQTCYENVKHVINMSRFISVYHLSTYFFTCLPRLITVLHIYVLACYVITFITFITFSYMFITSYHDLSHFFRLLDGTGCITKGQRVAHLFLHSSSSDPRASDVKGLPQVDNSITCRKTSCKHNRDAHAAHEG